MIVIGIEKNDEETWLPIKEFDGYFVSSAGRISSVRRSFPKLLKPEIDKDGYLRIRLYKNGKPVHMVVSRLVCMAFNGPPEKSNLVCCHRDNNKKNNVPGNLRWGTQASNIADKLIHGTHQVGNKHPRSVISENCAKEVKKALQSFPGKKGKLIYASQITGVPYSIVADISREKSWKEIQC